MTDSGQEYWSLINEACIYRSKVKLADNLKRKNVMEIYNTLTIFHSKNIIDKKNLILMFKSEI